MSRSLWLPTLISLSVLFCINILMISSIAPNLVFKQLIAWFLGLILFFIGKQINLKQLSSYKWPIFITSCILLFLPIILNSITRGSRRWIYFAGLTLQPSELVKPWLMSFLATTNLPLFHFIPVAIIMAQPDLGSAISVFFLIIPIILYNKKLLRLSLILGLIFILISPLVYKYVLHDYQQKRITTFLNPKADPLGEGYNVIQSQIAIGSGGFFGKGYKKGTQGQLLFLPEKHTDFMFATTAEELGFIGITIVLFAYYLLVSSLFNKAFSTKNRALFLFTLGIAIQIWIQTFINIGMNIGLLPVTGIPLPFISVGGSSIMTLLFSLGIIYSS
ncbi:MAG: FtsW/RodA/SpoVE family cell cycle protein [Candidatus Shapirobacteria bacterium]|nr:FtsW/RodA/SpoVE family cell cycle protein [Candidatus Shapirobacteria bacterium]MDD4410455.1 FtsW/RodA/SpoVE family cell cycle protein [Candidatus Shapirobacteria bacterium]